MGREARLVPAGAGRAARPLTGGRTAPAARAQAGAFHRRGAFPGAGNAPSGAAEHAPRPRVSAVGAGTP
jgi:hypothetical protein